MKATIKYILVFLVITTSCKEDPPGNRYNINNINNGWSIPVDEVVSGGISKDGIASLVLPDKVRADDPVHNYLAAGDLVLGYKNGDEISAYPHSILDYHEIINDRSGDVSLAITYCPLTGTGIAWERILEGEETTFGVTGLLYNANLIPYDRKTTSFWSQIQSECVHGELIRSKAETFHLVEMPWREWKEMYPESMVVSPSTGFDLSYKNYPYGNYKTNSSFVVTPVSRDYMDRRLEFKERVLAVTGVNRAKVYRFESFSDSLTLIHDEFIETDMVIAGIKDKYMVAYNRLIEPGVNLNFTPLPDRNEVIMKDQEGNEWDLFGEAVSGPRKGQQLKSVKSFMAYWFSISAFYIEPLIY